MKRIYMVMAEWTYEGSAPVRAFASKRGAELFAMKCVAHTRTKPPGPKTIEDTPENDAEFDAWTTAMDAWSKRHPAKPYESADSFSISKINFVD